MLALTPLQNLKAFAISRPPLVVFTACLMTFAIATLSLSYYYRTGPVRNPDVHMDWNSIMEHMSQWRLCIATASQKRLKPLTMFEGERPYLQPSIKDNPVLWDTKTPNSSVSVSLRLRLGFRAAELPKDMDILWGAIYPEDLGFHASIPKKIVAVIDLGEKHHLVNCTIDGYCDLVPAACVTFLGPVASLPTVREPKTCLSRKVKDDDATFKVLHLNQQDDVSTYCSGVTVFQEYIHDPLFEETLSYKEQALMNMHLTYTSYFLFVMVMTVICYAVIRGQTKPKTATLLDKTTSV